MGSCQTVSRVTTLGNHSFVSTNNNLFTYIMTMPNLDATWHWWVESLVRFMFSSKYQKGCNNVTPDALSQVTSKLDAKTVKSILDRVTVGMTERADAHDLVVAKADEEIHKAVQETAILAQAVCIDLHVTYWVTTHQDDPILKTAIEWVSGQKVQDLRNLLGDDTNTKDWQIGGSSLICNAQSWVSSCYEWMSLRCWTPGPASDIMLATWLILVARYDSSDVEDN